MVQPIQFGFNEETAESNSFQQKPLDYLRQSIQEKALTEFNVFVDALRTNGITVVVYKDTLDQFTPDSIFPNNWISTHSNGRLITYPMAVSNRRNERNPIIIKDLIRDFGYEHLNLTNWENEHPPRYLEGTGSMILDRTNRVCYAAISPRTHLNALETFCRLNDYLAISFEAHGASHEPIYHTNVMLSVGETFVVVGLNTVVERDRNRLIGQFEATGKTIIEFANEQIYSDFAGNMLQVRNNRGERILVMSKKINDSLTDIQRSLLDEHNDLLLAIDIPTIESVGGGSVRCMMAEIFKPLK